MFLLGFVFKGFNFMFQTQQDTKTETLIGKDKIQRFNVIFVKFLTFLGRPSQAGLNTNKSKDYYRNIARSQTAAQSTCQGVKMLLLKYF